MRDKAKNVINVLRWQNNNRPKWNSMQRNYSFVRRRKLRAEIIQLLGGKCINPYNIDHGEFFAFLECLQIDHVHGDGNKTRGKKGSEMYLKHILTEIKAGSKDYQLLCANCNWIKRHRNNEFPKHLP